MDPMTKPVVNMVHRVAIATDLDGPLWPSDGFQCFDTVQEIAADSGILVEPVPWDDETVCWERYSLVLPLLSLNYTYNHEQFRHWLASLKKSGVTVLNSPSLLLWNMEKSYMVDLANKGIPVVDTVIVESADFSMSSAVEIAKNKGWMECVIKPSIGSRSHFCYKFNIDRHTGAYTTADTIEVDQLVKVAPQVLIQKFMPSVTKEGEMGVLIFDGVPSFVILKSPPKGNFRLGFKERSYHLVSDPPEEALELARRVLSILDEVPLYGRVDMLKNENGQVCVSELELIEPGLYLDIFPEANKTLCNAILKRLNIQ